MRGRDGTSDAKAVPRSADVPTTRKTGGGGTVEEQHVMSTRLKNSM